MEKHLEVWKNLAHKLPKAQRLKDGWNQKPRKRMIHAKEGGGGTECKRDVMISFNDSPAKWSASFQSMSHSHKSCRLLG